MRISIPKITLKASLIAVFAAVLIAISPSLVSAQSSGPDFQITSSKDISAIQGESFTYFVVTENNTSYQLSSELPAGLSFSNNQISGTPQEAGEFSLRFTATDSSGSTNQTVNLTVINPGGSQPSPGSVSDSSGSQSGSDSTSGSSPNDQLAQSQGSVGLNEIPDTGMSADQALTVSFYALALLLLSWATVRKLSPRLATSNEPADIPAIESTTQQTSEHGQQRSGNQIGDGIVSK